MYVIRSSIGEYSKNRIHIATQWKFFFILVYTYPERKVNGTIDNGPQAHGAQYVYRGFFGIIVYIVNNSINISMFLYFVDVMVDY